MGSLKRPWICCLGALLLVTAIHGCSDTEPIQTSLSALKAAQLDYNGRQVVVSGTLRTFDAPKHYWIENDDLDRVELVGADGLEPLVGQTVEVSGLFVYAPEAGRRIEVLRLRARGAE